MGASVRECRCYVWRASSSHSKRTARWPRQERRAFEKRTARWMRCGVMGALPIFMTTAASEEASPSSEDGDAWRSEDAEADQGEDTHDDSDASEVGDDEDADALTANDETATPPEKAAPPHQADKAPPPADAAPPTKPAEGDKDTTLSELETDKLRSADEAPAAPPADDVAVPPPPPSEPSVITGGAIQSYSELYLPTVMIHAPSSRPYVQGSGVIVYSGEAPKPAATGKKGKGSGGGGGGDAEAAHGDEEARYATYILTNHHVIKDCIHYEHEWDPIKRADRKVEKKVSVEVIIPQHLSTYKIIGKMTITADIVAYWPGSEKKQYSRDLALLRLRDTDHQYIAAYLLPKDAPDKPAPLDQVQAVGFPGGVGPILTEGYMSRYWTDEYNYDWWTYSAMTTRGNSGGGVFRWSSTRGHWELVALSALVYAVPGNPSHIGHAIPITRAYDLMRIHGLSFIYEKPSGQTWEQVSGSA
ncbi:unnamed protein product [Vitrella brassicaformis CCMP3155]|uniref:Peptidase S1 domain-containing protein n=2 Tax=Vitrella brassicaformis TaxID=1169539 RepID=A0A0G4FML9_VITBC|nr:unnamed protein product [Vitrella brassicaformis CCMP3155]|eukprot:CEM14817.1 unnamed protein product [Vitrella brassicaformis CCMP3155]